MSDSDINNLLNLINHPESTGEQKIAAIKDAYSKLPEDEKTPIITKENKNLVPIIGKSILDGFTSDKEAMDSFEEIRKKHNGEKTIGGKKRKTRKVKKGKKTRKVKKGKKTKKSKKSRKYKK